MGWGWPAIHIAGCGSLKSLVDAKKYDLESPEEKPKKILLTSGVPWVAPGPPNAPRPPRKRKYESNYKFLLQFNFQRPINIDCWKRIRAPRGWRKCPTNAAAQLKFFSVRFQCRDMKYALAPEDIEELRARLNLSLELTW